MYKASIDSYEFDIDFGKEIMLNDNVQPLHFHDEEKGSVSVSLNGESKIADIVKIDKETKLVTLRIQGKKFTVQLKEPIDLLLDKIGIKNDHHKKVNHLKAPMPGLIVKVIAEVGKSYKEGEALLILEAMKMENVFKAAADVVVKDIKIDEKETVEKGQILMLFE